jgi:hypothetical protein
MGIKKLVEISLLSSCLLFSPQIKAENIVIDQKDIDNYSFNEIRHAISTPEECSEFLLQLKYEKDIDFSNRLNKQFYNLIPDAKKSLYFLDFFISGRCLDLIDFWKSCNRTLKDGRGDCDDFAILSGGVLEDDGYKPQMLIMYCNKSFNGIFIEPSSENCDLGHAIFYYTKENGTFGYLDRGIYKEGYADVESLVKSFPQDFKSYQEIYFDAFKADWKNYSGNLRRFLPENCFEVKNVNK